MTVGNEAMGNDGSIVCKQFDRESRVHAAPVLVKVNRLKTELRTARIKA